MSSLLVSGSETTPVKKRKHSSDSPLSNLPFPKKAKHSSKKHSDDHISHGDAKPYSAKITRTEGRTNVPSSTLKTSSSASPFPSPFSKKTVNLYIHLAPIFSGNVLDGIHEQLN